MKRLWLLLCLWYCVSADQNWYTSIIPQNYTKEIPPADKTIIQVSVYFLQFHDYDENKMQISGDFYLRYYWNDSRLQADNIPEGMKPHIANSNLKYYIWVPDLFIPEAIRLERPMAPNSQLNINREEGSIRYSQKIHIRFPCLSSYTNPDVTCNLSIESFGFTSDAIDLEWKDENVGVSGEGVFVRELIMESITTKKSEVALSIGNYSRLFATINFRKDMKYFMKTFINEVASARDVLK